MNSLEAVLGHQFTDREVLLRALTHSSLANEQAIAGGELPLRDNEQLEFLGDSVLGFLTAEELVRRFPAAREGTLSKLKAHLVSAAHLYGVAQKLGLGAYLQIGRGEERTGGREKRTLLVNSFEAVIAALYLDGGVEPAREFIRRTVFANGGQADDLLERSDSPFDFKSALQELARARKLPPPRYTTVKERGPEHSKTFTVEVRVGKDWIAQAEGLTKKGAAQQAAREIYEKLALEA